MGNSIQRTDPVSDMIDIDANKSNTVDLPAVCRGFHVNVAGNVNVLPAEGTISRTLVVLAGMYYPYAIKRVLTTGTTATGLFGLI